MNKEKRRERLKELFTTYLVTISRSDMEVIEFINKLTKQHKFSEYVREKIREDLKNENNSVE